jgi:hypothetical protein
MRKIINEKMYNTETATKIGNWWNGLGESDFRNVDETLYKKRTGEFFLYGEGGGLSRYASSNGNTRSSGKGIIPLTLEQAKEWGEEYLDCHEYEEAFGKVDE